MPKKRAVPTRSHLLHPKPVKVGIFIQSASQPSHHHAKYWLWHISNRWIILPGSSSTVSNFPLMIRWRHRPVAAQCQTAEWQRGAPDLGNFALLWDPWLTDESLQQGKELFKSTLQTHTTQWRSTNSSDVSLQSPPKIVRVCVCVFVCSYVAPLKNAHTLIPMHTPSHCFYLSE